MRRHTITGVAGKDTGEGVRIVIGETGSDENTMKLVNHLLVGDRIQADFSLGSDDRREIMYAHRQAGGLATTEPQVAAPNPDIGRQLRYVG